MHLNKCYLFIGCNLFLKQDVFDMLNFDGSLRIKFKEEGLKCVLFDLQRPLSNIGSHLSQYLKKADSNIGIKTNQPPHINRIGQQQYPPFNPVDTAGLFFKPSANNKQ
jgi:hypothetical protein